MRLYTIHVAPNVERFNLIEQHVLDTNKTLDICLGIHDYYTGTLFITCNFKCIMCIMRLSFSGFLLLFPMKYFLLCLAIGRWSSYSMVRNLHFFNHPNRLQYGSRDTTSFSIAHWKIKTPYQCAIYPGISCKSIANLNKITFLGCKRVHQPVCGTVQAT